MANRSTYEIVVDRDAFGEIDDYAFYDAYENAIGILIENPHFVSNDDTHRFAADATLRFTAYDDDVRAFVATLDVPPDAYRRVADA